MLVISMATISFHKSPSLPPSPLGTGVPVGHLSSWLLHTLLHTLHHSHTEVHGQISAYWGEGGVKGNLFLGALKYHFLFESFPKFLLVILKINLREIAFILSM